MAYKICPVCKSKNIRRSRTRTLKEFLFKPIGMRTYRCKEKDCGWRGLIMTPRIFKQIDKLSNYFLILLLAIVLIFFIVQAVAIMKWYFSTAFFR